MTLKHPTINEYRQQVSELEQRLNNVLSRREQEAEFLQKKQELKRLEIKKQNLALQRLITWADENRVRDLPRDIEELKTLTKLTIRSGWMEEVPEEIGSLTNLEELLIKGRYELTSISDNIMYLEKLKYLQIEDCEKLNQLPSTIGKLHNLEKLWVKRTKIKFLPDSICELTNLTHLGITDNNLVSIPENISNLKKLEFISFSGNFLTSIPKGIWELKSLKELFIHNNLISEIPESVGKLRNLECFYITHNKIKILPKSLVNLVNLNVLDASNNLLEKPDWHHELPCRTYFEDLSTVNVWAMRLFVKYKERELKKIQAGL